MKRLFALAVAVGLVGCLEYPVKGKPDAGPPPDWEVEQPPKIGGGGGGGSAKAPLAVPGCTTESPTSVLYLVRVDRLTSNLASEYAVLHNELRVALQDQGFVVRDVGAANLYSGELVWSQEGTVSLSGALSQAAERESTAKPTTCPTTGMETLLGSLDAEPAFQHPAGALLVVALDSGDRPKPWGDPACNLQGVNPAQYFAGAAEAVWLNAQTEGWRVPREQTHFVFVHTSEDGTRDDKSRCAASPNVSDVAVEAIDPSEYPYYGPLISSMNSHAPGLADQVDMCGALDGFELHAKEIASAFKARLRTMAK